MVIEKIYIINKYKSVSKLLHISKGIVFFCFVNIMLMLIIKEVVVVTQTPDLPKGLQLS